MRVETSLSCTGSVQGSSSCHHPHLAADGTKSYPIHALISLLGWLLRQLKPEEKIGAGSHVKRLRVVFSCIGRDERRPRVAPGVEVNRHLQLIIRPKPKSPE